MSVMQTLAYRPTVTDGVEPGLLDFKGVDEPIDLQQDTSV
jgi:hypothetical protein